MTASSVVHNSANGASVSAPNASAAENESTNTDSGARGWRKTPEGWKSPNPRDEQIAFQIRAGRPFKEIAAQFGISTARISQLRHELGIERRRNPRVPR